MSTEPTIEFVYDFGSPNAYLVHVVVPQLEQKLDTKIVYSPILLGGVFNSTGNVSPAISLAGIKNKGEYMQLETQRFVRRWGLASSYASNPHFPVNTLLMMRIATAAHTGDQDTYQKIISCFMDAMWVDAKKMDDPELVAEALNNAGLPAEELLAAAVEADNKKALIDITERSVERGVFGAPSFLVGDELFLVKTRFMKSKRNFSDNEVMHDIDHDLGINDATFVSTYLDSGRVGFVLSP